jgi:hypothetical protein
MSGNSTLFPGKLDSLEPAGTDFFSHLEKSGIKIHYLVLFIFFMAESTATITPLLTQIYVTSDVRFQKQLV